MRLINTLKTGFLSVLALGATSCKQVPHAKFQELNQLEPEVVQGLDRVASKTQEILKDTAYKYFAKDTIPINFSFYKNLEKTIDEINSTAQRAIPEVVTHTSKEVVFVPIKNGGLNRYEMVVPHSQPQYTDVKAVVNSEKLYKNDYDLCYYLPIEYYGHVNPKAIPMKTE